MGCYARGTARPPRVMRQLMTTRFATPQPPKSGSQNLRHGEKAPARTRMRWSFLRASCLLALLLGACGGQVTDPREDPSRPRTVHARDAANDTGSTTDREGSTLDSSVPTLSPGQAKPGAAESGDASAASTVLGERDA